MVAIFATMSLAFTGCSSDDDEPSTGGNITINGVNYQLSDVMVMDGGWSNGTGEFGFWVVKSGDSTPHGFWFEFSSNKKPKVGDNLADMDLLLDPSTSGFDDAVGIWDNDNFESVEFTKESGTAVVKSISSDQMTVQFSNLKMTGSGVDMVTYEPRSFSFTINGTATVEF